MLTQSLLLAAFVGALFLLLVTSLRAAYVNALSPDPLSAAAATSYLSWFIPAMALQFPMVVMGAALRMMSVPPDAPQTLNVQAPARPAATEARPPAFRPEELDERPALKKDKTAGRALPAAQNA